MTRNNYMTILSQKLRRLPKEDYEKAMNYFEEYFEEAGPDNELQAIEDLGSPEAAANELIMDLAARTTQDPPKTVKHGLSAVWIGILGVCAAPIALPLAFAFLAVIIALMITVLALVFSLVLAAVLLVAAGIIGIVGSCVLLFSNFADALATIGLSLASLGVGIAWVYGCGLFCRWFLKKISKSLGRIAKGGKKHETIQ